ncbi:MAG: hypothetical protein JSS02_19280, partial [Planctomycetes bacterium]|nr:hypothetical protein [Planctomycetota bacterium]
MLSRTLWQLWCRNLFANFSRSRPRTSLRRQVRFSLRPLASAAEILESREMLSTITVTTLADAVNIGDGVSLREAIQAANTAKSVDGSVAGEVGVQNVIVFQSGLTGTIALDQSLDQLAITSSVKIMGLGASSTIIDAGHNQRIFSVALGSGNVEFSNLTIQNGATTSNYGSGAGAGIFSQTAGTLTLQNCVVTGNRTTGSHAYGGAIYAKGPVVVTNSTISNNSTTGNYTSGGAIAVFSSAVTISNSTLTGNSTAGDYSHGGAIYTLTSTGTVTVWNSTFYNNSTAGYNTYGGAINATSGNVNIVNTTITGNRVNGGARSEGGGIDVSKGSITITNSIVAGNSASSGYGIDVKFNNFINNATAKAFNSIIGVNSNTPRFAYPFQPAPLGHPDANGNLIGTKANPIDPKLGTLGSFGGPTMTIPLLPGSPAFNGGSNSLAKDPTNSDNNTNALTFDQRGSGFNRIISGTVDIGAFEYNTNLTDTTPVSSHNSVEGSDTGNVVLMTFNDSEVAAKAGDFTITNINWGGAVTKASAQVQFVSQSAGVSTWQVVGHATYTKPGNYQVNLAVQDHIGTTVTTSNTSFTVTDAPLTDTTPPQFVSGQEGVPNINVVLMTFTDGNPAASANDFSVINLTWGGELAGTTPKISVVADPSYSGAGSGWKVIADSVAYKQKGVYLVQLTVHDAYGSEASTNHTSFNIADATLIDTTPVATIHVTEGLVVSGPVIMTFTDLNPYALATDFSIDSIWWGGTLAGGTPSVSIVADPSYSGSGSGWKVVVNSVTFAETGMHQLMVTVDDVDGSTVSTSSTSVSVADAPLTDNTPLQTISGYRGLSTNNVVIMKFVDANPYAPVTDFSVSSISWGGTLSGNTPVLSIVADASYSGSGSGWKIVANAVTYKNNGTYPVTLTVHDVDGQEVSSSQTTFSITDAPLTDTTPTKVINGTEGAALSSVVLMTFSDANPFDTAGDFSVKTLNWGGPLAGASPTVTIVADTNYVGVGTGWKVVANSVTFLDAGNYKVSMTIHHSDGREISSSNKLTFSIADAPLTDTTPQVAYSGTEGFANTNVVLMKFTDANPYALVSDYTATSLNWGGTLAGATPQVTIVADPVYAGAGTGWLVLADSVTYVASGSHTVTLQVTDEDGSQAGTAQTSFDLADAALTDTTPSSTISAVSGIANSNIVLMTFTDANPYEQASSFVVSAINWDGTLMGQAPNLTIVADASYVGSGTGWKVLADTVTYVPAGLHTVALTIGDIGGNSVQTSKTSFNVVPGAVSNAKSVVTLSSPNVAVTGTDVVTLQAADAQGNLLKTGGLNVSFSLANAAGGLGTFGAVTDNKNGTYTTTFKGVVAGTNLVTAKISGQPVTTTPAAITVAAFPSLSKSVLTLSSPTDLAGSDITVTLTTKDNSGNNLLAAGLKVAFALGSANGGKGTFGQVTDNHDGTYTATFTGSTTGANTITATVGGAAVSSPAPSVTVVAGQASLSKSSLTISAPSVVSGSSVTVTLQALDAFGNKITTGGLSVGFGLAKVSGGQGTFSPTIDNKNGTYTSTLTGTLVGSNSITATIGGQAVTSTSPSISVTIGALSLAKSAVTLSSSAIASTGVSLVTLQAADAAGNKFTTGGLTVALSLANVVSVGTLGTLSAVTDNKNGTYTAKFTGQATGTGTIVGKIGGVTLTSPAAPISVTSAPSLANSVVTLSSASVASGTGITVKLQTKDALGNNLTAGGLAAALT